MKINLSTRLIISMAIGGLIPVIALAYYGISSANKIARTMMAPSKINKASLPDFKFSMKFPLVFYASLWGIQKSVSVQFALK